MYYKTYANLKKKFSIKKSNKPLFNKNTEFNFIIDLSESSIYKSFRNKFKGKIKWFKHAPGEIHNLSKRMTYQNSKLNKLSHFQYLNKDIILLNN